MGRHYPLGYPYFRNRLHTAFSKNVHLESEREIEKALEKAEYVRKGWS